MKNNLVINSLLIRFLKVFEKAMPVYDDECMKRILEGYKTLGFGAITVSLYHPELRKKYDSKIILISQDYLKVFFAYLHARYPKCDNFPAISLLAKTTYFPTGVEKPIGQDSDETSLVYCVPEYWSVIYDARKREWYRIRSEDTLYTDSPFWERVKKDDMYKLGSGWGVGREEMVIDQLNFLYRFFSDVKGMNPKNTIDQLERMKTNQNTEPIRQALLDMSRCAISLDKSMYWDVEMRQTVRQDMPKGMKNFYLFRNIGIDALVDNAILLDVLF